MRRNDGYRYELHPRALSDLEDELGVEYKERKAKETNLSVVLLLLLDGLLLVLLLLSGGLLGSVLGSEGSSSSRGDGLNVGDGIGGSVLLVSELGGT